MTENRPSEGPGLTLSPSTNQVEEDPQTKKAKVDQVDQEIGHGGFGTVFLRKRPGAPPLAIKRIKDKFAFFNELDKLTRVSKLGGCDFIVRLEGTATTHEIPMEVALCSVGVYLRRCPTGQFLNYDVVIWTIRCILQGLQFLHHYDMNHNDVKPENALIFVCDNGGIIVKLCDLGLTAREYEGGFKAPSGHLATFPYAAPECLAGGNYSARSDVWSVAMTCQELMTLTHPFKPPYTAFNILLQLTRSVPNPAWCSPLTSQLGLVRSTACTEVYPIWKRVKRGSYRPHSYPIPRATS